MLCRGWHPLCELILICVYRVIVIWVIIVRIWHIDLPSCNHYCSTEKGILYCVTRCHAPPNRGFLGSYYATGRHAASILVTHRLHKKGWRKSPWTPPPAKTHCVFFREVLAVWLMEGDGFAPSKAIGQQIYSLPRLSTSVSFRVSRVFRCPGSWTHTGVRPHPPHEGSDGPPTSGRDPALL